MDRFDVVIVGGGPAGLSAALLLGRCIRRVRVFDARKPRNSASRHVNGFLSRDGMPPAALRAEALAQLSKYDSVSVVEDEVDAIEVIEEGRSFLVRARGGGSVLARRVLLATGLVDRMPAIEGIEDFWGSSVHSCPYCEAYEARGKKLAALGRGKNAMELALGLLRWSDDVVLITHGKGGLGEVELARLARNGVPVEERRISSFEGNKFAKAIRRAVFDDGESLAIDYVFFTWGHDQGSELTRALGMRCTDNDEVDADLDCATSVRGVYVAGDASKNANFVAIAVGKGAQAAFAINVSLVEEERA